LHLLDLLGWGRKDGPGCREGKGNLYRLRRYTRNWKGGSLYRRFGPGIGQLSTGYLFSLLVVKFWKRHRDTHCISSCLESTLNRFTSLLESLVFLSEYVVEPLVLKLTFSLKLLLLILHPTKSKLSVHDITNAQAAAPKPYNQLPLYLSYMIH
jgi:hypothetical protein